MARVVINGKQVACKFFPAGKKHGPEWRAAKQWEEEQKKEALAGIVTLTDLERLMEWGKKYLDHAKRTTCHETYLRKKGIMQRFYTFCGAKGIKSLENITVAKAYSFLSEINDEKSGMSANTFRKQLLTAWKWGVDFIDGFPQVIPPFKKVKPFPYKSEGRYVPPDEDFIKLLNVAKGQDLVMLLTFYFTGARRNEIMSLSWEDVNLTEEKICLTDNKTGNGTQRRRWIKMHPELVQALMWWKENRPCKVDNVFMNTRYNNETLGNPYTKRCGFMKRLCIKAGVKHFSFHAIRHKSAAIAFKNSGLNAAQILMGHYQATTTDRYIKSAGLYTNQEDIVEALGGNDIGQMVGHLLSNNISKAV